MQTLYAVRGKDPARMTKQILEAAKLEQYIGKNDSVALKPNLVVAKTYKSGATTNPAICAQIVEYLFEHGIKNISIIESSWIGEKTSRAFEVCGYNELANRYGVELVDVKKDEMVIKEYGGLKVQVSRRALETDYLINLPLIKGHCQTKMTCALKNLKGLISDKEKRRFHQLGLTEPIAYLNKMISADYIIADGTWTDPTFEEGGNPEALDVMIAGRDPVLLDTYAAGLLGMKPENIGYLKLAEEIGIGSGDIESAEIIELGKGEGRTAKRDERMEHVEGFIEQDNACSACYANLVSAMLQTGAEKKVSIGQGFEGKTGKLGCGDCTSLFERYVKGCPPEVDDIVKELEGS